MDPKFQSSFIPKGPFAPTSLGAPIGRKVKEEKTLFGFLALVIFILSILLALGMFGYKYYLKYRIDKMGDDLAEAQAALEPDTIHELTRLDNQINTTKSLISKHRAITPLFEFLQRSTPKTVRFNDFRFSTSGQGLALSMKGEARGYAALALAADVFNKSQNFTNSTFSNLNLNDKGDVNFTYDAVVDQKLLSYSNLIEGTATTSRVTTERSVATSSATSTRN